MYDFACEHCTGKVRERRVDREALRHKGSFVILENVPIGVCDGCGARYCDASVLRRVAEIGRAQFRRCKPSKSPWRPTRRCEERDPIILAMRFGVRRFIAAFAW